ncbi:MAG: HD domain-containing protein [Candidatus Sumerlaeaceae bacterium]
MIVEKLYRDPVHDLIALNKNSAEDRLLMQLIDSAPMQRLRRIRQLGMAYYAYQGAEHSRFTHSLGVMYLATRILDHLAKEWQISPFQRLAVRCAALLHDIGHGPFSHVFEQVTGVPHEVWTKRLLLDPTSDVYQLLTAFSQRLPKTIVEILHGRSRPPFLSQIITSQLDADRFDYLLRDSLVTGVKYGVYELERLIHVLHLDATGERIVVAANGIPPVEKYLQARYHMYTQVYFHKTVRAAESMLVLVLRRAKELCASPQKKLIPIPPALSRILAAPATATIEDFLSITDDTLLHTLSQWQDTSDPVLSTLAHGLLVRRLFKTLDVSTAKNIKKKLAAAREIISQTGFDSRYFLMLYEGKNVAYRPYDPRDSQSYHHVLVELRGRKGQYVDIASVSPLVEGLARASGSVRRVVFPEELGGVRLRAIFENIFQ